MDKVAIAITVFGDPPKLANLVDNMRWAGLPDIPLYVFEDPSPTHRLDITPQYQEVAKGKKLPHFQTAPTWGCMQGIIDYAVRHIDAEWVIYIPDDVIFTKGGLWSEYAGVLAYGRSFVGGIQAPFWNSEDLVSMGCMPSRECMYKGWTPEGIPRNPHWDHKGLPRKYINLNGAGFSLNKKLYKKMGGWPKCTWRLDEWAGYQAWMQGMVCITLPGPPRIHYMGGATHLMPEWKPNYSSVEAWMEATGGFSPSECGIQVQRVMDQIEDGDWNGILSFFNEGGSLTRGEAQCA